MRPFTLTEDLLKFAKSKNSTFSFATLKLILGREMVDDPDLVNELSPSSYRLFSALTTSVNTFQSRFRLP